MTLLKASWFDDEVFSSQCGLAKNGGDMNTSAKSIWAEVVDSLGIKVGANSAAGVRGTEKI